MKCFTKQIDVAFLLFSILYRGLSAAGLLFIELYQLFLGNKQRLSHVSQTFIDQTSYQQLGTIHYFHCDHLGSAIRADRPAN